MKPINKEKALVVFSGGQDSTTCLFWAKKHFKTVEALTFVYGQKHVKEVEVAEAIARKAGVVWHKMDVSFISQLAKNSLTDSSITMDQEKPADGPPNTFVPGRNLFFLSIAAVLARDCRDAFIKSLNVSLNLGMDEQFVIHTPLMWIDKARTWALADELRVFELVRARTLTCYNGVVGDGCGECPACKLRQKGLEKYLATRNTEA